MEGKIVKGIAGFYYVHVKENYVYECKAKGVFRNRKIKPLVGDNVIIEVIDEEKKLGNIVDILPRDNELIRPAAANIDQAIIIFAATNPEPNLNLLDKFLVMMDYQNLPTIICFNKCDIADESRLEELKSIYENSNCRVLITSTKENIGLEELKECLKSKTTVLAGPSGVGKSSITNFLLPGDDTMETGEISRIGRGRHTTRHSEIFNVEGDTYICDTPGFTSFMLPAIEKEELRFYFPEINSYEGGCRFDGCVHVNEPDCAVKTGLANGEINEKRYSSYVELYTELKNVRKY